jgi:DNA primase
VRTIDIKELKDYIINNDKIEAVLIALNCHHIKDRGKYFACARPNGDNPQSIIVYKDNLSIEMYTGEKIQGDLIALTMGLKKMDFISALKWLHSILGLEWKNKKTKPKSEPQSDPLSVFTSKIKSKHKYDVNNIDIYDEDILMDFGDCIHQDYSKGRITEKVRREFGLCYDFQRKRTVIPWKNQNGIVGISGRTSIPLYKELDIPKFYSYQGFQKGKCVYGFCENYAHIQNNGYTVLYEAEKSVLIRASLNDKTGLAIGSSNITDEQVRLILSLNCDIVVALDNDQSVDHIRSICEKFWLYRNVYYIKDKWGIMGEKDSPADMKNKQFEFLLKYKIKYDDAEHRKYLRYLEEQKKKGSGYN